MWKPTKGKIREIKLLKVIIKTNILEVSYLFFKLWNIVATIKDKKPETTTKNTLKKGKTWSQYCISQKINKGHHDINRFSTKPIKSFAFFCIPSISVGSLHDIQQNLVSRCLQEWQALSATASIHVLPQKQMPAKRWLTDLSCFHGEKP